MSDQGNEGSAATSLATLNDYSREIIFETLMREYEAVKAESTARIGFRDNLLYVNLGAIGAVFAYTLKTGAHPDALLVIPWIAFILGWTYLVNDRHISRLGQYVREELRKQLYVAFDFMGKHDPIDPKNPLKPTKEIDNLIDIFRWEPFHRSDNTRGERKLMQIFVDLTTFIFIGWVAIAVFLYQPGDPTKGEWILIVCDGVALFALAVWIICYADVKKSVLAVLKKWKNPKTP